MMWVPKLALEGIRELDEELTVDLLEAVLRRQHPIVAVADEHDRLPVQLVREQHLAAQRAVLGSSAEGVKTGLAIFRHILSGAAHEHPGGKRVRASHSRDARHEQSPTRAKVVVHV